MALAEPGTSRLQVNLIALTARMANQCLLTGSFSMFIKWFLNTYINISLLLFFILAVKLMTDWKLRQEWDKTATVVDVLDRIGNFKVVYK